MFTNSSAGGHLESKQQKPVIVLKKKSRQEHESKKEVEDDPFNIQPESLKSPKAKQSHKSSAERQKAQILLNNAKYNSGGLTN